MLSCSYANDDSVTAYEACEASCPLDMTISPQTRTCGACKDDPTWEFAGHSCSAFVSTFGAETCASEA